MAEILIVEDDRLQQALIERFLRPEHTVIGHVATARSAFEFAIRHNPDVAIIDVNLEAGDGIAAATRIKTSSAETDVIISTFYVSDQMRETIREIPADGYLPKPYSKQELLETIEQTIQ